MATLDHIYNIKVKILKEFCFVLAGGVIFKVELMHF